MMKQKDEMNLKVEKNENKQENNRLNRTKKLKKRDIF